MALHYDLTKIVNKDSLCWTKEKELHPVTNAIIWLSIILDVGELNNEKDVQEFYWRGRFYFKYLDGYMIMTMQKGKKTPRYLTLEEIRKHIGIKMNVFTTTRKVWLKRMIELMERNLEGDIYSENRKKAEVI